MKSYLITLKDGFGDESQLGIEFPDGEVNYQVLRNTIGNLIQEGVSFTDGGMEEIVITIQKRVV